MTPAQIHNHLTTLTANAAKALEAVPVNPSTIDDKGKTKGKGKGKEDKGKTDKGKDKGKGKGKEKSKPDANTALTAGNLAAASGTGTHNAGQMPGGSQAGSVHSGNTARSTATAGGTRVAARTPPTWYRCHVCQSPKHYRNECPQEADIRKDRASGGTQPSIGGGAAVGAKKPLDKTWAATQLCHKNATCSGRTSWCAFMHTCDSASHSDNDDDSNYARVLEISKDLDVIMREISDEKLGIKIAYEISPQEAQHSDSGLSLPCGPRSFESLLDLGEILSYKFRSFTFSANFC